ncbi:putative ribosome biogenesis protein BRX1-like isoform X2 [Apostichopus japonicus]|uniref:Ribosome biogenesis protein BRX1 homolog n=1 Tax=Stichopus japonicus TaxID=307972 RepID=A0A2G8JVG7_STIJA|nr:putative ribosome biogenesis protein BRX1-like isoform X2 [Apostichopus japonicus]
MGKRKAIEQIVKRQKRLRNTERVESKTEKSGDKEKWTNKQRVLIFASRGVSFLARHLASDLRTLMPHARADSKLDKAKGFFEINEICEMRNCNKCIFFEARKRDMYLWTSNTPHGPSAKFLIENIHTLAELKMTGNCLRGSRPILSFDPEFDNLPHYQILKELFTQMFGTPKLHPRSQPFIDHVFTFSIADDRIWFRNYQIIEEDGSLTEIGPRFVLNPIKIFRGSFGGPMLYENPKYVSPNQYRAQLKKNAGLRFKNKVESQMGHQVRKMKDTYNIDPLDEIFTTIKPEDAKGQEKLTYYRRKRSHPKDAGEKIAATP